MKTAYLRNILLLLVAAAGVIQAADPSALIVTASNATSNQLLVYNTGGQLVQTLSTKGTGGASGNAGGIETRGGLVAVVNFGSKSVTIFERFFNTFQLTQVVPTVANPVSVAFGVDHLYILGAAKVESHAMFGTYVNPNPDGVVALLVADGSAAQVGVLPGQLIITEKSATIETVNLLANNAVSGAATLVKNIPASPLAPFGLITRGNDAYVTVAHSNDVTLVRDGTVLTVVQPGLQAAPCWLALSGPFLYSSNSPSMSVSRFAVYGQKIVLDAEVAAKFTGTPTDMDTKEGMLAVIDGAASSSHLSLFSKDEDGNLTLEYVKTISGAINGVAIVPAI